MERGHNLSVNSGPPVAKRILVTGGLGFLGSHTSLQLLEQGFQVVIFDNTSNATEAVLDRISHLLKEQAAATNLEFVQGDIRNAEELELVFAKTR
jgi:UDP-glucose 4-epimerase